MDHPAPARALNPQISQELSDLIEKLLAKDPAGRPSSAQEAVTTLRTLERQVGLGSGSMPAGVFVPVGLPLHPEPNPWAEINEPTAPEEEPAAVEPSPRRSRFRWPLVVGLAALLAVVAAAGVIVVKITNKDGTTTEIRVPEGATVTVEKGGKPAAVVGPEKVPQPAPKVPEASDDADRRAAAMLLKLGGSVNISQDGKPSLLKPGDPLPAEAFEVTALHVYYNKEFSDEHLASLGGLKHVGAFAIAHTGVTGKDLKVLHTLPKLWNLSLLGPSIDDAWLERL